MITWGGKAVLLLMHFRDCLAVAEFDQSTGAILHGTLLTHCNTKNTVAREKWLELESALTTTRGVDSEA